MKAKGWIEGGVSVVTSTWNERENIMKLIPLIRDVLKGVEHEVIVVDDGSPNGTFQAAKELADVAIKKRREGQTKGLACGMKSAEYPYIATIDADLENDPWLIPSLLESLSKYDVVVASRRKLPRISEKLASATLGKLLGVKDVFSNFRAYKKNVVWDIEPNLGETYGAEFLLRAKKKGYRIGEVMCALTPPRRSNPRIGGPISSNLKITLALVKLLIHYA